MPSSLHSSERDSPSSPPPPPAVTSEIDESSKQAAKEGTSASLPSSSSPPSPPPSTEWWPRLKAFLWQNEFLFLILFAISMARVYPPLGSKYVYPKITSQWLAVMIIFLLAGLGLQTSEFAFAFQQWKFNIFVQVYDIGVVSVGVYGLSLALKELNIMSTHLVEGMVVCSCLPMSINMVIVLTKMAGGSDAAAIFNTAFGNFLGVFISPLLVYAYLGVSADIKLFDVFYKLAVRVLLPVVVGQVLQKLIPAVGEFSLKHKVALKMAQQYLLVFIVYTVFCSTFGDKLEGAPIGDVFLMILFQLFSMVTAMVFAWFLLLKFFSHDRKLCVTGLFGCTHKTIAMGIPLIHAMYEKSPLLGIYTLPILIWHPMQLVVGSLLVPRLSAWIEAGKPMEAPDKVTDAEAPTSGEVHSGIQHALEEDGPTW